MKLTSIGKFLDQPLLSNALNRKMPLILTGAAALYGLKDTFEAPREKRKDRVVRNISILGSITLFTLLGANFIKIKGEKLIDSTPKAEILKNQSKAIDEFLANNPKTPAKTQIILDKAKTKMLNLSETDELLDNIQGKDYAKELSKALFSEKKNITSKEILQEISKLSTLGFIPVASGILGGIAADKITHKDSKEKTVNKVKEGIYQFFANIFLCNVGAGSFMFCAEKLNEKGIIKNFTPAKKTAVILAGILTVGVVLGSCIANFLGNKVVNPLINKITGSKDNNSNKKEERKPEPLDIALHTDDIATAGVLSGVRWIEPLLPVMYLVSGYRAGIGYRNNAQNELDKNKKDNYS